MILQILRAGPSLSPRYFIIMSELSSSNAFPEKVFKFTTRFKWPEKSTTSCAILDFKSDLENL